MTRERECAKLAKLGRQEREKMSNKQLSSRPRRCKGRGGTSGKSNNGGAAPRFEQAGLYRQPGRRAPHHVEAGVI